MDFAHPIERLQKDFKSMGENCTSSIECQQFFSLRSMMAKYHLAHMADRQDMAHSVEGRPPILDHHFFDFCAQIPRSFLLRDGKEKYIFRKAMENRVLPEVAWGSKWPFAAPLFSPARVFGSPRFATAETDEFI